MNDIETLKKSLDIVDVMRGYGLNVQRSGALYECKCPFHADRTASLKIYPDHFYCYGCKASGDVLAFMARYEDMEFRDVIKREFTQLGIASVRVQRLPRKEARIPRQLPGFPVIPAPEGTKFLLGGSDGWTKDILNPGNKDKPISRLPIDSLHAYRLSDGSLYGYVVRTPKKKGRKITPPVMWLSGVKMPDSSIREGWTYCSFPDPRPPYGLDSLAAHAATNDLKRAVIMEGEKKIDLSRKILSDLGYATIGWCGGANAVNKTDWSQLKGYVVILWPDNDEPGLNTMAELAFKLQTLGCKVYILQPPEGKSKGWDAADAVQPLPDEEGVIEDPWGPDQFEQFLETALPAEMFIRHREGKLAAAPDDQSREAEISGNTANREASAADTNVLISEQPTDPEQVVSPQSHVLTGDLMSVDQVLEMTAQDITYPFNEIVIDWILVLQETNGGQTQKLISGLKRLGISQRRLTKTIEKRARELADAKANELGIETETQEQQKLVEKIDFRPLGHSNDRYYYLSNETGEVVVLTSKEHKFPMLYRLTTSEQFWNTFYTKINRRTGEPIGLDQEKASRDLIRMCNQRGHFSIEDKIRGRGGWYDLDIGKSVFNLGDRLVIDGKTQPIGYVEGSAYIYGPGPRILPETVNFDEIEELTVEEGTELLNVICSWPWSNPAAGWLAAGMVVTMPVSGALKYRAHAWLTGPSGAGKTTLLKQVIKPTIVNDWVQIATGRTTGAGITQYTKQDSRSWILDETERKSEKAANRIGDILEIMRSATGEAMSTMTGTADQSGKVTSMTGQILLSSISVPLTDAADKNRIMVLELRPVPTTGSEFEKRKAVMRAVIIPVMKKWKDPSMRIRLMKRMVGRLDELRAAAAVFSEAATDYFTNDRLGQGIGMLLAGTWLLISNDPITYAEASDIIKARNWSDWRIAATEELDHESILGRIRISLLETDAYEVNDAGMINGGRLRRVTRTIYQLVETACGFGPVDDGVTQQHALAALQKVGIDPRDKGGIIGIVRLAKNSEFIASIFGKEDYAKTWHKELGRIETAINARQQDRIPGYGPCYWVGMPVSMFIGVGID